MGWGVGPEGNEHRRRRGAGQDAAHHLDEEGSITTEGDTAKGVVDVTIAIAVSRSSDASGPLAVADVGIAIGGHAYAFRSSILRWRSMSSAMGRAV